MAQLDLTELTLEGRDGANTMVGNVGNEGKDATTRQQRQQSAPLLVTPILLCNKFNDSTLTDGSSSTLPRSQIQLSLVVDVDTRKDVVSRRDVLSTVMDLSC